MRPDGLPSVQPHESGNPGHVLLWQGAVQPQLLADARHLLLRDARAAASRAGDDQLRNIAALPWVETLDEVRQRVLVDMAFNLGIPSLLTFKRTLASVEAGNYTVAAAQMLESKWARQVGTRAIRLSEMMATGQDSADF